MNKIDLKLVAFLKEWFRIRHEDILTFTNVAGALCELTKADQTKREKDKIAPRVLIVTFEYDRIHRERWLLNVDGKEGSDRRLTLKEQQNIPHKYLSGNFSVRIKGPKETEEQIIWDFSGFQEMYNYGGVPLLFGEIEKLIVYDKRKQIFE